MGRKYRHLSQGERDRIAVWRAEAVPLRAMARRLGRSPATLSRELRRNRAPRYRNCYLAHRAQERAVRRWRVEHHKPRLKSAALRRAVRRQLLAGWSPELIAGRRAHLGRRERISHEAIYQWIYAEARELIAALARSHRRRRRRGPDRKHDSKIPARISIRERPASIARRRSAGHWEVDLAVCRTRPAVLAVAAERRSRFTKIRRLPARNAHLLRLTLTRGLARYPQRLRRSFTYDNGSENVEHVAVNRALGSRSYFCEPMHSWQKGTVENRIGLIRRRYPKGTDFGQLNPRDIRRLEYSVNHRPCKLLKFQTPAEAFRRACCT